MTHKENRSSFSRRTLLKGIGAGAAALTVGSTLVRVSGISAQSNPTPASEAAFYRFRVGSFDVTVITDGYLNLPPAVLGTNAPEGAVSALLADNYLPTDLFTAPAHVMLVNTGEQLVLIDTGLGGVALPGFETDSGKLVPTMQLLGLDPADVNAVIVSHAHPDHIGGIRDSEGNPQFPNATYHISQLEWDFWMNAATDTDNDLANFFATLAQNTLLPLEDRVQRFEGETDILPGIRVVPAAGHTPGHTAVIIGTGDDRVINIADATLHYIIGLEEPTWQTGLEVDPVVAEQSRVALLSRASGERIKVFGYHFPFPGIGYAVRDGESERWEFVITG
ncbi:MAG: MBL fold metallo-hydrolase [bacterium]|nr:MBL fold metallo-hydrolase [bacterium]